MGSKYLLARTTYPREVRLMKNFNTLPAVITLVAVCLLAIFVGSALQPVQVQAATVVTETQDNTMPSQLWVTDSMHGTCSSASPETFSIAIPEAIFPWNMTPTTVIGKYDAMLLFYQISSVTDEWIIETDYFYKDTDANNKRDSFQCTATGADSGSPWHLLMMNWRGI